jgi:hypothetical protein
VNSCPIASLCRLIAAFTSGILDILVLDVSLFALDEVITSMLLCEMLSAIRALADQLPVL